MYIIDHKHHLLRNKSTNNTHTESISTQPKRGNPRTSKNYTQLRVNNTKTIKWLKTPLIVFIGKALHLRFQPTPS